MTPKEALLADTVNKHPLAKAKVFYFFHTAISKSLPGYLASYYKHVLLLSPHQVSILVAARYFAVLFGSPVLGSIADRLNRFRNILVVTLLALLFTYLIVPIVEPIDGFNCKHHLNKNNTNVTAKLLRPHLEHIKSIPKSQLDPIKGHYHSKLMYGLFYSWPFETWEYEETDYITKKVFITLLIVTLIGEFFASPSETFIDVYTIQTLKENSHRYGLQILSGRCGWIMVSGVFLLIQSRTKNYTQDFCYVGHLINSTPYLFIIYGMIFICIMVALLLVYDTGRKETAYADRESLFCIGFKHVKCINALYLVLRKPSYAIFALAVVFAGFGQGTKTLFVYSYLKELGGSAYLYLVFLIINFISNVIALIFSPWLLKKFGHVNLIAGGLLCSGVTFIIYSLIENPSLVMLVEPFDGISSSLSWVALITYVGCPPHIGAALQGLMHGLYRGLGLAIGYFIVSVFILKFGYFALFISLGLSYFVMSGLYLSVTFFWPARTISEEYTNYYVHQEVNVSESDTELSDFNEKDTHHLLRTQK